MIIAKTDDKIGGEYVDCQVNENYVGRCEVKTFNDVLVGIFPNLEVGISIARYAITPDGGYGSVEIIECSEKIITHESFDDWFD
jgi:hypothetical protein